MILLGRKFEFSFVNSAKNKVFLEKLPLSTLYSSYLRKRRTVKQLKNIRNIWEKNRFVNTAKFQQTTIFLL